jgi:hypothetical protein
MAEVSIKIGSDERLSWFRVVIEDTLRYHAFLRRLKQDCSGTSDAAKELLELEKLLGVLSAEPQSVQIVERLCPLLANTFRQTAVIMREAHKQAEQADFYQYVANTAAARA